MADRELLELAAKAAGITWDRDSEGWFSSDQYVRMDWNPLTDDGDALRLAVKLQLPFDRDGNVCMSVAGGQLYEEQAQDFGGDPYVATRRAITRAAAALGTTHD